jgi:putative methanogenesis marker protein 8
MVKTAAEYRIGKEANKTTIHIRKQNRDISRYFADFPMDEPLNEAALEDLIKKAEDKAGITLPIIEKNIGDEIVLATENGDSEAQDAFIDAFLDALKEFCEDHEVHVTRMFGSFIYLKKVGGQLKAVKATPVPIRHCPLMKQLLTEVGGEAAGILLPSIESGDAESQTEMMCRLINEVVIKGGYFDTSRPLNSCEANVLFGASEMMSTAFRKGFIDAAVIVSNNLGTIITTNGSNTQGAVKRMTGLFLTSPSGKLTETALEAGIIPVFPHTAAIDQAAGVKLAIGLGYKKIAVSVAWMDNILLNEIGDLEENGVTIYKFGLCSTGIDEMAAQAMENNADLIWSCASKMIRARIEPNAIAQVGVKIPVHIMTDEGWQLVKNHIEVTSEDRGGKAAGLDDVVCRKGKEKPVILNDTDHFRIIAAKDQNECLDCPQPCV